VKRVKESNISRVKPRRNIIIDIISIRSIKP